MNFILLKILNYKKTKTLVISFRVGKWRYLIKAGKQLEKLAILLTP